MLDKEPTIPTLSSPNINDNSAPLIASVSSLAAYLIEVHDNKITISDLKKELIKNTKTTNQQWGFSQLEEPIKSQMYIDKSDPNQIYPSGV